MGEMLLVIDEGTTSTRAMLFAPDGRVLGSRAEPLTQSYPAPGRVEHDAAEIWAKSRDCAAAMVEAAGGPDAIAAIGITNQRETIVFWDKRTGEPLAPAIVWQDRRTAAICRKLKDAGHEPDVQAKTGLLLDPYFSGSKIGWAMAEWPQLTEAGEHLAVGTIESWLVWKLTGGLHVTDATNASRTALMAIGSGGWDDGLVELFGAPIAALPEIVDCAGRFGETTLFGGAIPICGLAGDQQAATIGQSCLKRGETKATYGTGAFVLTQAGTTPPRSAPPAALDGRLAAQGQAALCAGGIGVRRRQPRPVAARLARADRRRGGDRGARAERRGQRRRGAGARAQRHGRALVGAGGTGEPHRAQLRHHPRACRPRRAGGDGARIARPEDRVRRRRRGLEDVADRRRHGRQRLDGAGPSRHARHTVERPRWRRPLRSARRCCRGSAADCSATSRRRVPCGARSRPSAPAISAARGRRGWRAGARRLKV